MLNPDYHNRTEHDTPHVARRDQLETLRTFAAEAYASGLSIVPTRQDGSKRPVGEWKRYQRERATEAQVRAWYHNLALTGIGVVTGEVSRLEMLEFEDMATYRAFTAAARDCGYGPLIDRIEGGWSDQTPGGGIHYYYRCSTIDGNTPLAKTAQGKPRIETRGEGGYTVVAPSYGATHPSGRPYRLLKGGPATIATITPEERADLFDLARTFDQTPVREISTPAPTTAAAADGTRPGDVFNETATWEEILEPHGWTRLFESQGVTYWRRPGKDRGISATTNWNGTGCLRVFTTSTMLEPKMYRKFSAHVALNHDGDASAAARALMPRVHAAPSPVAVDDAPPANLTTADLWAMLKAEQAARIAAEERANQLALERSHIMAILRNGDLSTGERLTGFAVALDLHARTANGEQPRDHGYRAYARRYAEMTGQSEGTAARQLRNLSDKGLITKHVVREQTEYEDPDLETGEILTARGLRDVNYIEVPEGKVINIIDRLATYQRPDDEGRHGGTRTPRPACKHHPDAGTYTVRHEHIECAQCHAVLEEAEPKRTYHPPINDDGESSPINLVPVTTHLYDVLSDSKMTPEPDAPSASTAIKMTPAKPPAATCGAIGCSAPVERDGMRCPEHTMHKPSEQPFALEVSA